MIKRMLAIDGVQVVCHFRDDGELVEGYGMMDEQQIAGLAHFAHDYKRIVQGNTDQLSMFTQMNGWTPPGGWIVRSDKVAVVSIANLVCLIDNDEASLNEVMREMNTLAHW
ncbi:hypothetical protein MNBD_GAMMA23-1610 [hydrothermal vent metagenome]|uniref:Roadblock/LAMTOR2 domain-containing protein n=1 Tax=hydrothermal vent metagenome TaxID=652676 RepID=A0A3B1AGB1_9ZZZZ